VHSGAIARVETIRTWTGFAVPAPATDIRHVPALGGWAMLDVGCYCVTAAIAVLDTEPSSMAAWQSQAPLGVEEATYGLLGLFSQWRR
jgi:predicted dehydrogenase